MDMDISLIGLELLGIVVICIVLIGSQVLITRILLRNVAILISNLDQNLADAVQAVIESKINENVPAAPPGLAVLMEILKNAKSQDQKPRGEDGKFKVIENITEPGHEKKDT